MGWRLYLERFFSFVPIFFNFMYMILYILPVFAEFHYFCICNLHGRFVACIYFVMDFLGVHN